MKEKPQAKLLDVKAFFGFTSAKEMQAEWKELSDEDKEEIRELIAELDNK